MLGRLTPVLLALALGLGGCGGDGADDASSHVPGRTLTIYTSLPRTGPLAGAAEAVAAGQRRALRDAGGRAGSYRVRLVQLDSARRYGPGSWDPGMVERAARRAAEDPTTIAYLGELDLGASAISIPVTNKAGIVQVSPADGLTSLTRVPASRPNARPERLYAEQRNFLRLVPVDSLQARALAGWAHDSGARTVAIYHDTGIYGDELAAQTASAARRLGIEPTEVKRLPGLGGARELAARLAADPPGAVIYTGDVEEATPALLTAIHEALPALPIYVGSAVVQAPAGARPSSLGLLGVARTFPAERYPARARRALRALARTNRAQARPEALYGYESVELVLDAIAAAGPRGGERTAVLREALRPRSRSSVLGRYRVRPGGDVSTKALAGYAIEGPERRYQGPLPSGR